MKNITKNEKPEKQFRTFNTMFISFKKALAKYLRKLKIYFEISGGNGWYHFEILCDTEEADLINAWISANSILNVEA